MVRSKIRSVTVAIAAGGVGLAALPALTQQPTAPPVARYTMDAGTMSGMAAMGAGGGVGQAMAVLRGGITSGQALTPLPIDVFDDGIDDADGPEVTMIAPRVPSRVSPGPQTGNPTPPANASLFFIQVAALDRSRHGIGVNRAGVILDAAFGAALGWDDPETRVSELWKDKDQRRIHDALVTIVSKFGGVTVGERKTFTGFSRRAQFAAARPTREGVRLGLAVDLKASKRLSPPKRSEGWSDRNKAVAVLTSTKDIDPELKGLLRAAFDAS